MLTSLTNRVNTFLLVLLVLMAGAIIAILAGRAGAGPLDPPGAPGSTDAVRLPGTPISSAPFTISQPGHYYLTRNLHVTGAQKALTIDSSDVSLDLGGFTVSGDDSATSYGVLINGVRSNVRVSNGTLSDFESGLDGQDDIWVRVDGVSAISNQYGFKIGFATVLSGCMSAGNNLGGISILGPRSTVRDCTVDAYSGFGVLVGSDRDVLRDNTIKVGAAATGVLVDGALDGVYDNSVTCEYGGVSEGIELIGSNSGTIKGNSAGACDIGISTDSASKANTIDDNVVVANSEFGISLDANSTTTQPNVIRRNVATANSNGTGNYNLLLTGNDFGPDGTAHTSTDPNGNISN